MPAIALAAMRRKQRRHACGGSVRYQVRTIDSARTASRTRRNSGSGEMHMVRYVPRKASQFADCPDFRVSASPDIAVPAAAFAAYRRVDAAGGKHNRPSMSSPKRHSRAAFAYTRRQGRIDAMYVCGQAGGRIDLRSSTNAINHIWANAFSVSNLRDPPANCQCGFRSVRLALTGLRL
jgi:hypothetical protein